MNSSSTSSITPAKSHKKREIKIPQVDSVQVLLRPLMTSLPKELNALNMHYQKTLDQVFYEELEKTKMELSETIMHLEQEKIYSRAKSDTLKVVQKENTKKDKQIAEYKGRD